MINKIYKRTHNKYFILFKSFLFLRYVFAVFLISTTLFLTIPKFFDYEKKQEIIKKYLFDYYDLELKDYSLIEFKVLPLPNLSIKNVNLKVKNKSLNIKSDNIKIFLNLKNIYNYENLKIEKIYLNRSKLFLDVSKTKELINYLGKLKNKYSVRNLNLDLRKEDTLLINIKNINVSNYGYKKYEITGEIFEKKFKSSFKENSQNLNFKLLKTGIKANIEFNKKELNSTSGSAKINLSNNLIKFDFILNNNKLKIFKSNFRNKDLSVSLDSFIKFNPFFSVISNIDIKEIDNSLIEKVNLEKILKKKEFIKKLKHKININYQSKKYFTYLIKSYSSNLNLAYGRLIFSNKILIAGGEIDCEGNSALTDNYPRLNFNCFFNLKDKRSVFKKFSISKDISKGSLNLSIEGSLNLLNKKVNFKKINTDNNYLANKEDIKYFKEKFENILFNEGFFQIFNKNKIKEFLIEII